MWICLLLSAGCAADGSFSTGGILPGYSNQEIARMRPKLKQVEYPQPLGTTARRLGLEDQKVSHRVTPVAHKAAMKNHVATTKKRYRLNLWHILTVTQAHLRDAEGRRTVVEIDGTIEVLESSYE